MNNVSLRSKFWVAICLFCFGALAGNQPVSAQPPTKLPYIKVSPVNQHYFETSDGKPFFWLGDTGWLLFVKCSREDVLYYLDTRKAQGYNVVQVMVLHTLGAKTVYGATALENKDLTKPLVTAGNSFGEGVAYDYWDHVEFVIKEAAKRGIYMALVPIWGSAVKEGKITPAQAGVYGKFLAERYKNYPNIIWLNGGDIKPDEAMGAWNVLGSTIKQYDPLHLMTYHPRGRYSSTDWFHQAPWLDFNMVQSGHRTYAQDTSANEKHYFGEDNWRYIAHDYNLKPIKPVLDGEPSYENIPYGLHDSLQTRWSDAELRRYAYWSVFAGAAGFTYGENAVMQFHTQGDADANFGVTGNWKETINAPGATQMVFLKKLILSKNDFSRKPAQEILVNNKERYDYCMATKGNGYAWVYTYTGISFMLNASKLGFKPSKTSWYRPADGSVVKAALKLKTGNYNCNPPGERKEGNDWVLILEK